MASRSRTRLWLVIALVVTGAAAAILIAASRSRHASRSEPAAPVLPGAVACLGRIQPEGGPVVVGARSLSGQPSLVGRLLVNEGDDVETGQVLAILDSAALLEASWRHAEAQVDLARRRRDQVGAGAETGEIAAKQAEIARIEVELADARTTHARTARLFEGGSVTGSELERSLLAVETRVRVLEQARDELRSLTEANPIDLVVADAEVRAAIANAARARAEMEAATIRAPYAGRILKIHAWAGEEVDASGIVELGRVERMYVLAEVAEQDVQRVAAGQVATITGAGLTEPLAGRVERVGHRVSRNSMVQENPVGLTDARIVEVWIRLDEPSSVRHLTDALVEVRIETG